MCDISYDFLSFISNSILYISLFSSLFIIVYLYDSILSIPQKLLDKPRKAFLIPEFSMPYSTVPCDFWYECDTKALFLSSISKSQLKSCSKWGPCVSESSSNDNVMIIE